MARSPRNLGAILVAMTLTVSVPEFVALQSLPDDARRSRLGLPASCAPSITALHAVGQSDQITVLVECAAADAPPVVEPSLPSSATPYRRSSYQRGNQ